MKLKILHISDLHYTKGLKDNKVIDAFFKDINDLNVDFVFFTGDMTFSGTRDDFILFKKEYYSLLLERFPADRILFCPGNHDVDRGLVKKIIGKTMADQINSHNELKEVVSGHKTHWFYTTHRLKNYFKFLGTISSSYKGLKLHSYTKFYANYIFEIDGKEIGVSAFNSSWLAEGGQKDYGKLAIGSQNVEDAFKELKNCSLKLCMFHHPKEWLSPYDDSIDLIKKRYDYAFNGHNHEAKPEMQSTPHNDLVFSNTGCLHESDEYFNGYTILEIDEGQINFNVRTYFPKREEFDKAIDLFKNGSWTIEKRNLPKINSEAVHFQSYQAQALDAMITIEDDERSFKDRYVFPRISKDSFINKGQFSDPDKEDYLTQEDLFPIADKLIVNGKNESGKTCLLFYLGWETHIKEKKTPLYLNVEDLLDKGATPFFRELRNIANDSEIKDFQKKLEEGGCIILLDNIVQSEVKKNQKLQNFINKYPKNKFIASTKQSTLDSYKTTKEFSALTDFETIYLNSFEASNIREFIKIVKPDVQKEEVNVLVDNICSLLSRTGLPYNPTMVSILLDIQSQIGSFVPINKASLLEKLIEILLKKHDVSNISRGSFDYENQLDLLANFANVLYLKEGQFTIVKFEEFVNSYLQQIGIEDITSHSLLDLFIKSNILVKSSNNVEFKIGAFEHFFFAKYLNLYPEGIEAIMDGHNYLLVPETLDYLTGLERKNKELLERILSDLNAISIEADFEYEIASFDDLEIGAGVLSELMDENFVKEIKENEMPQSKKDELTQMRYPESQNDPVEVDILNPKEKFIVSLELTCNVIRNCELIKDLEFRENAVSEVMKHWTTMLVEIILSINNDDDFLEGKDLKDEEGFKQFINVVLPVALQSSIMESIGTAKLKAVLRNVLSKNSMSKMERLLIILILEEVDELTSYKYLNEFLKNNPDSYYIREIIYTYLMVSYELKPMSQSKRNKCINIMSEIVAKKSGHGNKRAEQMAKSNFVNKMKRNKKK